MKHHIFLILAIICVLSALACDVTVVVFQIILSLEKFGVIFGEGILMPHWSLALLAGNLLFILAYICVGRSAK